MRLKDRDEGRELGRAWGNGETKHRLFVKSPERVLFLKR